MFKNPRIFHLLPHHRKEVGREREPHRHLGEVEDPAVAAHDDVIVGQGEHEAGGGSVASDGSDGGHRERDEVGDNGGEGRDHGVEAGGALDGCGGGIGVGQVETVAEEPAAAAHDEGSAFAGGEGFGADPGEGGADLGDEAQREAVLAIAS